MGYYIQVPKNHNKAKQIVELYGGEILSKVPVWEELKSEEAAICVMDNIEFEAAGFAYSKRELEEFSNPKDNRPKIWVIMDRKKAEELTDFEG
jgi:hypothetical protein